MPGLIRGVARTAVVAGTASAAAGRVQRRQAEKYAERDAQIAAQQSQAYAQYAQPVPQQYAPAEQAPDPIDQLKQLGELRAQGILTEEEFAAQKARVLGSA